MAWYPGAVKMELQPESDQQAAIKPTQFIVHSIIAPWTARRTYEYWRDSTNLESHFGVDYEGTVGQYIGTETRADANAGANRRSDGTGAVSAETASNTSGSDPWNAKQIEDLIAIGVWLHQEHGIPLRICRSHSDPGYGYHSMFPQWSTSGTACPGTARIKQFKETVFPGIVARATGKTTEPEQEETVPHTLGRYDTTDRPLIPGKWTTLPIEGVDLLTGARAYQAMAQITAGLPDGATLQGRFYHHRTDDSRWTAGLSERQGTAGSTFADFHNCGSIAASEKLRFEVCYWPVEADDSKPITITTSRLRGLYWK
ncbi:peptidoglycan recognition protein family protein [Streptomyces alfalfae]|uniref:peptidoglycan recognition protein family protein n=1 Tax=Streptomyces alfalfae TaxID=1642299 RepID=UPI002811A92C|nr:N-acetylmuramoyl-L-alanine amidase [Streptomyces alfalfae]